MADQNSKQPDSTAILTDVIRQLAEAHKPQHPLAQAGFTPEQIEAITKPPKPRRWRRVACKSEETGATFEANVVESKGYTNGRITGILNYRHPSSAYITQSNGGRVPDGMPIFVNGAVSLRDGEEPRPDQLTPLFKQWRWDEYWKRDIRHHNGRELTSSVCAAPDGLRTPWQEGRVGALHE